jgi:hypothetical protein
MTPNDFLKIIQDSIHKQYEPVPKGWYLAQELSKVWNIGISQTCKKLQDGIKFGLVEKKDYFIKTKSGSMRKAQHYYFHEKKDHKKENQRTHMENTIRKRR